MPAWVLMQVEKSYGIAPSGATQATLRLYSLQQRVLTQRAPELGSTAAEK